MKEPIAKEAKKIWKTLPLKEKEKLSHKLLFTLLLTTGKGKHDANKK